MKKTTWIGIVLVVASLTVTFAQTKTAPPTAESAAVLKADNDRFVAMQKADMAALERLLGADLTYTHSSSTVQTKDEFLNDLKTGALKYLSIVPSDQKVRVYGSTAVVTGAAAVHILRGVDESFQFRYTSVHVRRDGAWQMVAWEATRLPQ